MSEPQSEPMATTATATDTTPSDPWGQPISEERQAERIRKDISTHG